MPNQSAQVPYSAGADMVAPEIASPNNYQQIQTNPNQFGAGIGEAVQKLGGTAEDLAQHYSGMMMETMSANAETQYMSKLSQVTNAYKSKEGLDAVNSYPQYQNDVSLLRQQFRDAMPLAAAHSFDQLALKHEAYALSDGSGYAATQMKQANIKANGALVANSINNMGNYDVASDDERAGFQLGTIKHATAMQMQTQGWGSVMTQDPKTGDINFADNLDGNNAKEIFNSTLNKNLGEAQYNRFTSLASQNVSTAYQKYQDVRGDVPPETQVKLDAYFKPKIRESSVDGYLSTAMAQVAQDHASSMVSGAGSNSYNLGNVKTADGASNNTSEFVNPASPVDGVILTANNLRSNYSGMTLQQIANKWAPPSENNTSDWLNNVSKASGISATSTPNLSDPAQLQSLLKGIAVAEKLPQDRALFTDDVLSRGVSAAISGKSATTGTATSAPMTSGYQTQADYMATHKDELINNAMSWARQHYPNDPVMENTARERMSNVISTAVQSQNANYKQDNQTVMKALAGDFSGGKSPSTFSELRSLPGIGDVLDRVAVQDSKFYETIDNKISQFSRKDTSTNSANGYETIMRTLEPSDSPNRIDSQDHLAKVLGRSDGTGINMKDYLDAKKSLDTSDVWKQFVSNNMKQITNANGNIDCLGQQRALQWYNQVSDLRQKTLATSTSAADEPKLIASIKDSMKPPTPDRMTQISNWAKSLVGVDKQTPQPAQQMATGANGEKYVLQGGQWVKQ